MSHSPETHLVFLLGGRHFGLPIQEVLEIVPMRSGSPCPGLLPGCLAILAYGDDHLPVLDPAVLATGCEALAVTTTFVVVRHGEALFGLAMDHFVSVLSLDAAAPLEADGPDAQESPYVETVHSFQGQPLFCLSTVAIGRLVRRRFPNQSGATSESVSNDKSLPPPEDVVQTFLCARLGDHLLAFPIEQVVEVIENHEVTPLFRMPTVVRGLINLRGKVLACLDFASALGFPPRPVEEQNRLVILQDQDAEMAFCLDKVMGIRRISTKQIHKTETILSGEMARFASGLVRETNEVLFVISVAALFESPELQPYRRSEE